MLRRFLRSTFQSKPQPHQPSQARGSKTLPSPGFGRGTEDCTLTLDARSTRRASHRAFLAWERQAPSVEAPGPQPPATEPGPLASGASRGRSGAARAVQTKEAERWDYFKGLLFLKAAFPVSLPDPRRDLLPASKFVPKQHKKLSSKT